MATSVGLDPNVFRSLLIDQKFAWHADGANWMVEIDTPEHKQMVGVLAKLFAAEHAAKKAPARTRAPAAPKKAATKAAKPKAD